MRWSILTTVLAALAGFVSSTSPATSSSIRLVASTPLSSFADPLALDSGNGVIASVFDSLTKIGGDGAVNPALATAWRAVSDTVWVFDLRDGVKFSNGRPLDADSVVAVLDMLTGPGALVYPVAADAAEILSSRALDTHRIEITTRGLDPRLPRKLSRIRIFDFVTFGEIGRSSFARAPVGTGPYVVERWINGDAGVVFRANPGSWRAPEQIDRVQIDIIADASARLQTLLSGDTDIANNLDPDSIAVLEASGMRAHIQPGPVVLSIALRGTGEAEPALQDVRVRRALNFAIDQNRIVEHLLSGTMKAAGQVGAPGAVGYDPNLTPYGYDPVRAKALLTEAGYASGFKLTAGVVTGQIPGDALIYQQVAQDLSAVGVDMEIRKLAFGDFNRRRVAGDWGDIDAFSFVWSHYQLGDITRSSELAACLRDMPWFCDREAEALLISANQTMDPAAREILLKRVAARFHDVAPSILLVEYAAINGLAPTVEHFVSDTDAILFGVMRMRPDRK